MPSELSRAQAQRDTLTFAAQSASGDDGIPLADVAAQLGAVRRTVTEMERFYSHLPRHTTLLHALATEHRSMCHTVRACLFFVLARW